jgi:plastocyanin
MMWSPLTRAPLRRSAAAVALLLAAACGGSHAPTSAGGVGVAIGPASAQTFALHGNDRDQFVPQTVSAVVGVLTLTLQNGGVPHDLAFNDSALPGIGVVDGSATKATTLTFSRPGTYVFTCTIHPGMEGRVVVKG